MSRILIILIFLIETIEAEVPKYREPDKRAVLSQVDFSRDAISKTDILRMKSRFRREYEEPSLIELDKQKENSLLVFGNANSLIENGGINNLLTEERKKLQEMGVGSFLFKIPEFVKREQMNRYLSEAETNSEKIAEDSKNKVHEQILVFVSLSMPASELKSLIKEAESFNASVFIRGLDKDYSRTMKKLKNIMGDKNGILIDPTLFEKFNVESVPTFILPLESLEKCRNNPCQSFHFLRGQGSISINYFLELIARTGDESERETASFHLSKLRI